MHTLTLFGTLVTICNRNPMLISFSVPQRVNHKTIKKIDEKIRFKSKKSDLNQINPIFLIFFKKSWFFYTLVPTEFLIPGTAFRSLITRLSLCRDDTAAPIEPNCAKLKYCYNLSQNSCFSHILREKLLQIIICITLFTMFFE